MNYCFVGPTLSDVDLRPYNSFQFLPPVKAGDINSLIQRSESSIDTIIIVDGLYHSRLSIRHKEIIAALWRGITVIGVGSLGALRAAELETTGMIGSGHVFSYFRSTMITADDEVSVVHTVEPPYTCSTLPLINVRLTLPKWVNEHLISPDQASQILDFYKKLHYTDRRERVLADFLKSLDISPGLTQSIIDYKKVDTLSLLAHFDESHGNAQSSQTKEFASGYYFSNYFVDQQFPLSTNTESRPIWNFADSVNSFRLHTLTYNSLNRHASLLLASSIGIKVNEDQIEAMKEFLVSTRGVSSSSYPKYKVLVHDSLFLATLAQEEAILFKLHLSLTERLGIPGLSRLRHYWLSIFHQSTFLQTVASHDQQMLESCLEKLYEHFNKTSPL